MHARSQTATPAAAAVADSLPLSNLRAPLHIRPYAPASTVLAATIDQTSAMLPRAAISTVAIAPIANATPHNARAVGLR